MKVLAAITIIMSVIFCIAICSAGRKEKRAAYIIGYLIAMCLVVCEFAFAVMYLLSV